MKKKSCFLLIRTHFVNIFHLCKETKMTYTFSTQRGLNRKAGRVDTSLEEECLRVRLQSLSHSCGPETRTTINIDNVIIHS